MKNQNFALLCAFFAIWPIENCDVKHDDDNDTTTVINPHGDLTLTLDSTTYDYYMENVASLDGTEELASAPGTPVEQDTNVGSPNL